ncbi:uncharacterized protein E5676_scaffold255G008160 [Cucumis melo var. makuwa]|uniref:Uncharacterized protein n=1 Tax=Cucumis melo var. makuwa TaxID=1194695 RepID=A0A5D3CMR7_CUCMM|nr:uncharacterized protein E5676_scaffold255G008160 [Cucumis melo var. makuwa]
MRQNSNGLDWFVNVFNKMEGRCLEMCDVLEKFNFTFLKQELLKYAKRQPNSVGSEDHFQQPHLGLGEDQSPEKEHRANQDAPSAGALSEATNNSD